MTMLVLRLVLVTVFSGICSLLSAHEASLTQAVVAMRSDGTYHVALDVDPVMLLVPEAQLSGGPRDAYAALSLAEQQRRLTELRQRFRAEIILRFDEKEVSPAVAIANFDHITDHYDQVLEGIILSGVIPPGAKTFQWQSTKDLGDLVLVVRRQGSEPSQEVVPAGGSSKIHHLDGSVEASRASAFAQFLRLGFTHIIPDGPDHILFVLGLFLGCLTIRQLLMQVTAFTLAHSMTLGLAWFGVVVLPGRFIETAIAASIAVIALENCTRSAGPGRWRPAVVFAFGLVHGMGFADILHQHQIHGAELATALVGFNLGVELAQLAVVLMAFLLVLSIRRRPWYRQRVVVPASLVIGVIGLVWAVLRVAT